MKQLFKSILLTLKEALWIPMVSLAAIVDIGTRLFVAAHLWCIVLVPYLTMMFVTLILSLLFGVLPHGLWDFTRAYFYDGTWFYFTAWRIHIVIYIMCLIETFRD